MNAPNAPAGQCPSCGTAAVGKFCSTCGTPLDVGPCIRCNAPLSAGARFCNECGTPVGQQVNLTGRRRAPRATSRIAAWIATVALVSLVVVVAVRIGTRSRPSGVTDAMTQGAAGVPDISNMSPRERAARLYDRVMRMHEEQKPDSVAFFAPMALSAYAAVPDIDQDGRYDMARIAMVAGVLPVARAQDDTMLKRDSTHLLGLLLGADLARAAGNESAAKQMESRFVSVAERERKRNLPEYQAHSLEIEGALRRLGGATTP